MTSTFLVDKFMEVLLFLRMLNQRQGMSCAERSSIPFSRRFYCCELTGQAVFHELIPQTRL